MNFTPPTEQNTSRLLDANLDRAREGIRVIEDWCRFGLERKDLVLKLKDWRHQLSLHHLEEYKKARSSLTDPGALLSHPQQINRKRSIDIIYANCARIEESLRVLEEFSRISNPELAKTAASIRFQVYEVEKIILQANAYKHRQSVLNSCKLYLITKEKDDLVESVSLALKSGIKMVQYRYKGSNDKKAILEASRIAQLCKKYNALLIINDRIDYALATDADGVHLGEDDMSIDIARKLLGEEKIIGRTANSIDQAIKAEKEGSDYIGIGPVFRTKNKPNKTLMGLETLEEILSKIKSPCFAIGGINMTNIGNIKQANCKRVAVINAILDSQNISLETANLLKEIS